MKGKEAMLILIGRRKRDLLRRSKRKLNGNLESLSMTISRLVRLLAILLNGLRHFSIRWNAIRHMLRDKE